MQHGQHRTLVAVTHAGVVALLQPHGLGRLSVQQVSVACDGTTLKRHVLQQHQQRGQFIAANHFLCATIVAHSCATSATSCKAGVSKAWSQGCFMF